jgi:phosphate transport system substrate-binding protein
VPLSVEEGDPAFEANANNAYSGDYPLARFLYIYLNKDPNDALDPLRAEFVKYINSNAGQEAVIKDGFYPISKALADDNLSRVGLEW